MESGMRAERSLKGKKQRPDVLRLVCLAVLILFLSGAFMGAAQGADKSDKDEDEVIYSDFTLGIGDRIDISNYRVELIEIQSVKDGIAVMQVSKIGGGLDEQRAFLVNRANNFVGGAEMGGITLTVILRSADIRWRQACPLRPEEL